MPVKILSIGGKKPKLYVGGRKKASYPTIRVNTGKNKEFVKQIKKSK